MPYILNKTNGAVLTILDDSTLDVTTNLTLVGRNYAGYGEFVNENLIKLLENFSNTTAPDKPITGQLWFDSSTSVKKIKVYDGKQFKTVPNINISNSKPENSQALTGDLWWDSSNKQLNVYDGTQFKVVGPSESARSSWESGEETTSTSELIPVLKGKIGTTPLVVISKKEFTPSSESELAANFATIKSGMTIATGYTIFGTVSTASVATTATSVQVTSTNTNTSFYVTFAGATSGSSVLNTDSDLSYNPGTNTLTAQNFSGISSSAKYADLAERYEADHFYDVGTVVVIGGEKEITETHRRADTAVAGIISKNPGYMLNAGAGNDNTHPYVALRGRVPCKVLGTVKKGDLLVTSFYPGYAEAAKSGDSPNAVLGKALEDFNGVKGVIEVLV
jgi:hypothetical protein